MNLWSHNTKLQSCIKFFSIGLHIKKIFTQVSASTLLKFFTQAKRTGAGATSNGDFYTPGIDAKLERVKPFHLSHINKSS